MGKIHDWYCDNDEKIMAYTFFIGSVLFLMDTSTRCKEYLRFNYIFWAALLFVIGSIPMVVNLYVNCNNKNRNNKNRNI